MGAVAAGATLLAATGAGATQSAPAEKPASTVSGVTVSPGAKSDPLVNPASQFVRNYLPQNAYAEQYPRFRDAICVKVQGLPEEFDAFVAARIVAMAKQVHAPLDKAADCTPNVNVIFTPDPQAQLDDIYKRRDVLLGFRFHSQIKKLTSFNRPIQAWYVTRTRDKHGESFLEIENPIPWNAPGGQKPVGEAGSRLGNQLTAEVVHSLILADASKVADAKIGTIADYISVLALARWREPTPCSADIPTILNLMADGCDAQNPPDEATPTDLALLRALYAVDPLESGAQQRVSIASRMQTELNKDEQDKGR
jgi:hypothetical protein